MNARGLGFEPRTTVLETVMLPITLSPLSSSGGSRTHDLHLMRMLCYRYTTLLEASGENRTHD